MNKKQQMRQQLGTWKREKIAATSASLQKLLGPRNYFYFNGAFEGEQRAVAAGIQAHHIGEREYTHRMFLRRSIHRLEKGLSSAEIRPTFATDYIGRTIATYNAIVADSGRGDAGELKWAHDVLNEYFRATADSKNPQIQAARRQWIDPVSIETPLVPFPHKPLHDPESSYLGLRRIACHRRSVRLFDDRPVERDLVERAVEIGLQAPSACNRQSLRLVLVDDVDLRQKVASVPMGTAGFASQIPLVAVLVGQLRGYEHERDRHAIFVDGGLFAMGFVLALEGSGLNSCCINWPDLKEKDRQMRTLIDLADDERVVMLIAVGYGTEGQLVPRSHKRSVAAVAEWK